MMNVILGSTREAGNPHGPKALSLIMAKDSRGCTPLHYLAYSRQCPFSSLKLMMDYCKPYYVEDTDGTTTRLDPSICVDSDGDTPLHWALDGYMSPRRVKELTRHSKEAMMVLNNAGKRPFDQFAANFIDSEWKVHDVCGREVWENIQAYLRVICDGDHTSEKETSHQDDRKSEWLPLHLIAGSSYDFPPIFTEIALHYSQNDLSKQNADGMLPLHLACQRRSSNIDFPCDGSRAHKMLAQYPQAAYKPVDATKRLAIHLALSTQKPMSLIAALIKAYPRSLNSPDPVTGLWPFVLAGVENEISVGVSFTLLRADPSILQLAMKDQLSSRGQRANEATTTTEYDDDEIEEHSSRRIRRLTIRDSYS
jgi:hypothetical protein